MLYSILRGISELINSTLNLSYRNSKSGIKRHLALFSSKMLRKPAPVPESKPEISTESHLLPQIKNRAGEILWLDPAFR